MKKASKESSKKAAPAPRKAAKAPLRNKTAAATKKVSAKKVGKTAGKAVRGKASRSAATKAAKPAKAGSAKGGSRTAEPKKKTAKRASSSKKVLKPAVAPRKAKKPLAAAKPAAAKKPARGESKAPAVAPRPVEPPPPPPRPAKLTPAQIEELRISKERRKAQERQADFYDKASGAFQARHFQRALTLFEKVAEGPDSTLTDRARVHISICQQQVKPLLVKLKTADEFYHYGIRLINERRFDEAGKSLNQALKIQPRGAHIHFAAAVLGALTRDMTGTYKSLKRAIELDPHIRVSALNDTDLAAAAKDPAISQLLHGNSTPSRGR